MRHDDRVDLLRPGYRELPPPAGLRGLLRCVWVQVATGREHKLVVPDACTDLVWRRGVGAFVAGPDTGPVPVASGPGDVFVGVRLRPGAGQIGLTVPLHELRDRRVPLRDVFHQAAAPPEDAEPAVALRALLGLLGERASRPTADPLLRHAIGQLACSESRVDTLATDLGVSERQLRRRFAAGVGYGPKTLHRVLRFQRAVHMLRRGEPGLATVAASAGYADQAHLSRECRILGGRPPSAIR